MNFLDKMERKYGRYALSHLTMYIIVTYIAGYIILASGELDSDSAEQSRHLYDYYAVFLLLNRNES